jgi:hypothetical protein
MAAIVEAIVFAAAAGFTFVIVISVIVIIGVRQEERYMTLEHRTAPSATAQLARIILGRYVRRESNGELDPGPDYQADSPVSSAGPRSWGR